MPSSTVEDYIKQIYLVAEKAPGESVLMGRVAEALGVVPGTATTMVKTLAEAGLVDYERRVGVRLTDRGRALALHVLRRHRLLEQFLVEVLGFDWSEVHEEAERMEHVVSDRLLERIDRFLGHATEDPHGDPIPNAAGELSDHVLETLESCALNKPLRVARISDQDTDFLLYVARAGLNPGAELHLLERNAAAQSVRLRLAEGGELTLGLGAASKIYVREQQG